ncbi:MAG: hypothetical protein AAFW98_03055 [Pseudomonadota bacterium]
MDRVVAVVMYPQKMDGTWRRVVGEGEFRQALYAALNTLDFTPDFVVGPGRSGAVAAVYASHYLRVPFVPYKCRIAGARPLCIDTARQSGSTLRKASRLYDGAPTLAVYEEPPRVRFWYEDTRS